LGAALEQILATLRPHRGVRADWHEGGREYFVVTGTEPTGARPRAPRRGFEGEIQPLHAGRGYRLALRKGRFAPRDPKLEAQFFASPADLREWFAAYAHIASGIWVAVTRQPKGYSQQRSVA
jgi:hypothetical protein